MEFQTHLIKPQVTLPNLTELVSILQDMLRTTPIATNLTMVSEVELIKITIHTLEVYLHKEFQTLLIKPLVTLLNLTVLVITPQDTLKITLIAASLTLALVVESIKTTSLSELCFLRKTKMCELMII